VEGVGNASPVTKWAAETISEELVLARIHWCPPFHRRRPKSMAATTWAAAGVRRGGEKGYGALEEKRVVATSSWCCAEHDGGLGSELRWLWPRPRHGRRRETLGRGGRWG